MKKIQEYRVTANETLNDRLYLLKLTTADDAELVHCAPGQFVEVRVDDEPHVFLRRPISIHRVDYASHTMELLIQKAGAGTLRLARLREGDLLNVVYPLGNGFTTTGTSQRYLLIGGGVGIAPLLELGAYLKAQDSSAQVTFLLGGRSAKDLVRLEEYALYGTLLITTEDGTTIPGYDCQQGFVTQHTGFKEGSFDAIRVCGPGPMMKAVAAKVKGWAKASEPNFCEVSLENKMACGLGVCLCCVEETKEEGNLCVCKEGPVFDINRLKW